MNRAWALPIAAVVGLIGWFLLRPQPVLVDLGVAQRGTLRVTVRDDGRTRIREKYMVSTPIAGRLIRIDWKPGDAVHAGETTLAVIEPTDPALLDPLSLAQARAREKAAAARLEQIEPRQKLAEYRLEYTQTELKRSQALAETKAISQHELKEALLAYEAAQAEHSEVLFARLIAEYELRMAQAVLIHTGHHSETRDGQSSTGQYSDGPMVRFPIAAPISGKILRVVQESATVLAAGAPLLEIGDPADLEIELDVLSTDAVKIRPGAEVRIEHWGGEQPLAAKVRLVEPSAFTKVSALGIEEQRVNVIIDFDRSADLSTLGDGYRVEASVVVWQADDVLKLPIGALYRQGSDWAVLVNESGRAVERIVEIGQRNDLEAQVLDGLEEGTQVVLHPGDRLQPGSRLKPRQY
jgi:HlyD family secretion protein